MLSQINWIDIVVLILLIRTSYVGLSRGLTKDFFSFLAIIITTCFSIHYYELLAGFLTSHMDFLNNKTAILLSFMLLVIGSLLIFKIFVYLISQLIKIEFASFLEKIGGLIIGIVYGFLLSSLLIIILSFSETDYIQGSLRRSWSAPFIIEIAPRTYDTVLKILPIQPSAGRLNIKTGFISK